MAKERIAIIDHETHTLFVEDVDMDIINKEYDGNEEDYITSTYSLSRDWSWDYITEAEYIPIDADPIEINFEEL